MRPAATMRTSMRGVLQSTDPSVAVCSASMRSISPMGSRPTRVRTAFTSPRVSGFDSSRPKIRAKAVLNNGSIRRLVSTV